MKNLNKKRKIRKIILGSFLGILIGSLLSVSYAFFTFNNTGINNKLIAGDIYMRYKETSAINLTGAMPSSTYPTEASGNYFEFQIVGKNTSSKDITYNVKLAYGDSIQGKDRITDSHLVFKLVEVVNNEEQTPALVEDQSYDTIPGATLYTGTIPHGTNNETTKTFRVYARISENVGIGTNTTYTIEQWNNLYASVKINVDGGFTGTTPVQLQETPASCFLTTENEDESLTIVGYDIASCGGDIVIPSQIDITENPPIGITNNNISNNITRMPNYEKDNNDNLVLKTDNNNLRSVTAIGNDALSGSSDAFDYGRTGEFNKPETSPENYGNYKITSVVIPDSVITIGNFAFSDNSITNLTIGNGVTTIGKYAFAENEISNLILGNSVTTIGNSAFRGNEDAEQNMGNIVLPGSVRSIGHQAFYNCGITNIDFPNTIPSDGIASEVFERNHITSLSIPTNWTYIGSLWFAGNEISSLNIPSNITEIKYGAFEYNYIRSLTLPSTVKKIGTFSFVNNSMTSLTIGYGLEYIDYYAFGYNYTGDTVNNYGRSYGRNRITELTIPGSVKYIGSYAFYNNEISSITLENGIESISKEDAAGALGAAFQKNRINSVVIPASVRIMQCNDFCDQKDNITTQVTYADSTFSCNGSYTC